MNQPSSPEPRPAGAVLVPLDGTSRATAAVPIARELANLLGATLTIIHQGPWTGSQRALGERLGLTPEQLRGAVLHHGGEGAAAGIVGAAAERQRSLIVMCPYTRVESPPEALGGVATGVLRATHCPVVLVPPARGLRPWTLRQLLFPHDGTPTSTEAVAPAAELAALAGAEFVVLHVATPSAALPREAGSLGAPRYVDQPQHEWPAWGAEFLDRLRARAGSRAPMKMRLVVAHEEAGPAIVQFTAANETDLVAVAWRGRLDPGRARTIRTVIRDSLCPILVIRVG